MGGKSKAPKPPDYAPLAAASQKSADYSYQLAQRQQDWAEKTYNDNKTISDQVIQKSMAALDQQTADAARDRARYQNVYQPLEDEFVQKAKDYASPGRQEVEAGKAAADVSANFDAARKAAQDRLESYGVDPSSTRSGALDLGTRIAQAAASASASNQARTATEDRGNAMLTQAIDIGRGYPGQISGEMQGAGQSGTQSVNTGLATTASGAQTMGTGQGWQGAGNQALGTWGNILGQGYSDKLNQFKANQSASSGWGSVLGSVAGIGLHAAFPAMFAEGGPIPAAASPSNGAIPDDIRAATGADTPPVQVNAGEFIIPKDVVQWEGEKGIQKMIMKARQQMASGKDRPAQPQAGAIPGAPGVPPGAPPGTPPIPSPGAPPVPRPGAPPPVPINSVGAIPPHPGQ